MKKLLTAAFLVLIVPAVLLGADEMKSEEDDLFSSPDTVIDSSKLDKKNSEDDQNKKHIGVSGKLTSMNSYIAGRPGAAGDQFQPYLIGDLYTDLRLPADVKAFGNFEVLYTASINKAEFFMRELFIDFNIDRAVYVRTGKQIIQWGRCYLWNPTDLVNVEKKPFLTKIGSLEGSNGIKIHVPFGTSVNLYGFAMTHRIDKASQIAGAGKIEFLIGGTEMAFSVWGKDHNHPVYGYDFSTRLLLIDIVGEVSLSHGSNTRKLRTLGNVLTTDRGDGKWIPKACIDLGHAFDFNGQPKTIQVNMEFFFNGDGYHQNIFRDNAIYTFDVPVKVRVDDFDLYVPSGTKALYLSANNLFQVNYHSRYYAALFITKNKFFTSDFTLKTNFLGNIAQKSFIANVGLAYANINDFNAGIEVYGFFGRRLTEYNFSGNAALILLTFGIVF